MELLSSDTSGVSKFYEDNANLNEERTDTVGEEVPTFAIHEKSLEGTSFHRLLDGHESSVSNSLENKASNLNQQDDGLINGEVEAAEFTNRNVVPRKVERKGSSVATGHGEFNIGQKSQDSSPKKVILTVHFMPCLVN